MRAMKNRKRWVIGGSSSFGSGIARSHADVMWRAR